MIFISDIVAIGHEAGAALITRPADGENYLLIISDYFDAQLEDIHTKAELAFLELEKRLLLREDSNFNTKKCLKCATK